MINIVLPMAGIKPFSEEMFLYPLPLIDIKSKPLIQYVLENLNTIEEEKRFIFILSEADCNKYHIDNTLKQLVNNASFVYLKNKTRGAVCSVLMGIDEIPAEEELLILNSDQVIELDYNAVLHSFRQHQADGGLITFESVHPRWSYARIEEGLVVETAEKNPISKNAIAGFYYFKNGQLFIDNAFQTILHEASYEGNFYTSSVFNEMVLSNKKILPFAINSKQYHSFYSPQKLKEFENFLTA